MERLMVIVADPVKAMLIKIWGYVPTIIGAILILVAGWFLAKLIEMVVVRVLKTVRLDAASDKAGIANILAQGDIKATVSELIGGIVYWIVILIVVATALNALNLTIAADILSKFVSYIPNILGAIFILILGAVLANFVSTIVYTASNNAGIENATFLSQLTRIILVVFSFIMAIEQLGIGVAVINLAISITLVSIGLGLALAFGLGCKDMAAKAMGEFLGKMKK